MEERIKYDMVQGSHPPHANITSCRFSFLALIGKKSNPHNPSFLEPDAGLCAFGDPALNEVFGLFVIDEHVDWAFRNVDPIKSSKTNPPKDFCLY
jgi:hypothetical protein